jgi:cytochrome oxidase Cu insertion factor (SCO1/SenC/PrrC family)
MRDRSSPTGRYLLALACFAATVSVTAVRSAPAAAEVKRHDPASLAVGKVAPDIEGEDVEGKKFKLSEYRGKVVVLDFWGDW